MSKLINVDLDLTGYIKYSTIAAPAAPASGLLLYNRVRANRDLPTFQNSDGRPIPLQPMLISSATGIWLPPGNSTAGPGVTGFFSPNVVGFTATARSVATTNYFTRRKRLGLVTAATAAAIGNFRTTNNQYSVGSGAGVGGFYFAMRFGCSDAATVAGARMFVGVGTSGTVPANVEPNTLINVIGIGHGAADTNMKLFFGGSAAQTPIDLGVNFPANTLSVDVYELILYAPPNTQTVFYQVSRLNTTDVASGVFPGTAGTAFPNSSTLINLWCWRTNNATALACGLDVMGVQMEPLDE